MSDLKSPEVSETTERPLLEEEIEQNAQRLLKEDREIFRQFPPFNDAPSKKYVEEGVHLSNYKVRFVIDRTI